MDIKHYFVTVLISFAAIWAAAASNNLPVVQNSDIGQITQTFQNIPDSIKTAIYWYWLSNNISKEGVVKDLHAMKKAGINRAFIGNIGINEIPYGKVPFMSPEWWEITEAALETATELGIEIGMFNSPGWSQSGGPWVKPEESMRYLKSSSVSVSGNGRQQEIVLPEINGIVRPVKVIAYPSINGESFAKEITKKHGEEAEAIFAIPEGTKIRNVILNTKAPFRSRVKICIPENGTYKTVAETWFDRCNPSPNVGFDPLAPVVISIPETETPEIKVVIGKDWDGSLRITLSTVPLIERYPEKTLAKMYQYPLPMWHEYMWPKQPEVQDNSLVVSPSSVVDITSHVKGNTASWKVPEGDWTVLYTWMATTGVTNTPAVPEATGLEIDKMSKTHIKSHFDAYIGEILKRIPEEKRKSFKILVQDSYETGGLNWTDDMPEYFIRNFGYDPTPYLPALFGNVVGSRDISDRFLWDLRRAVADRVAYDYVGGLRDICHENGLTTWLECYGHWGFPSEFLMYGGQSDEIGGEFWSEGSLGDIENKAAASCGHIYGKNRIWAESCTCGAPAYYRYPRMLKQRIDRFFAEGINSTLLHLYIQQPDDSKPGIASPTFGNEFNRNNTWFDYMDLFTDYLKRCCFILQQGQYVADVAYFIGEDTPKMTGTCDPPLPYGYSSDYINAEVLLGHSDVRNGKLVLDSGMEYDLLVLPKQKSMRPEVLSKISRLVKKGLTITGPAPEYSPSLQNYPAADRKVRTFAGKMWRNGKNNYGKGLVYPETDNLESIFSDLDITPDIRIYGCNRQNIRFIHRHLKDSEIYFISNQEDNITEATISFRVSGMVPQIWNPLTGEVTGVDYSDKGGRTEIAFSMNPLESMFVVFREDIQENQMTKSKTISKTEVNGTWTTEFRPYGKDNVFTVVSDRLYDWSESDNIEIRHYSGTAVYTTDITINRQENVSYRLNLGKVMVMAKIRINGHYAGGVWTDPYSLDITPFIKDGKNKIEISVVNNWMNRLIGDASLPGHLRSTSLNITQWSKDSKLQESGLIGPVTITSTISSK